MKWVFGQPLACLNTHFFDQLHLECRPNTHKE